MRVVQKPYAFASLILATAMALTIALICSASPPIKKQWDVPWVRKTPGSRGVIVFIHGVTGDARSTWLSGDQFWPGMLTEDSTFNGQDIYVYSYPSPRFRKTFSIDDIAENMRLVLTDDGVLKHEEVTFICHSMGGIVARAFILKYRPIAAKIRFIYFFATPTTGSPYATLA